MRVLIRLLSKTLTPFSSQRITTPLLTCVTGQKSQKRFIESSQEDSDKSELDNNIMDVNRVVKKLKLFAQPTLAAKWDNVGLLIEPSPPLVVKSMLFTNDLTLPVLEEAISKKVDMILSYHPPIFEPLKRLTQRSWKEMIATRCIENRIAVYSPHTSYDAVSGGVTDWLISPFVGKVDVIERSYQTNFPMGGGYRLEFTLPQDLEEKIQKQMESLLPTIPGVVIVSTVRMDTGGCRLTLNCTEKALSKAVDFLSQFDTVSGSVEIFKSEKPPIPSHGQGRVCVLSSQITIQEAIDKVKSHLQLKHIRLALAVGKNLDSKIKSVAVCAGSGSGTLERVEAGLYVTGEMSHHQVLDATHHGVTVILCDHSNTERGFLKVVSQKLSEMLDNQVQMIISEVDKDPLEIV